jgi:hypothetical protein
MADVKPTKVTLRTYQVGFGDCFLLIFGYSDDSEKFVLIDFGSTGLPDGLPKDQMLRVAKSIRKRCGGQLDVVVATHRHKDHISGFDDKGTKDEVEKKTTGEIIAECQPKMVIQSWTEDPELEETARGSKNLLNNKALKHEYDKTGGNKLFSTQLHNMHRVAHIVIDEAARLGTKASGDGSLGFVQPLDDQRKELLTVLGDNNIKNKDAVRNLRAMSKNPQYVYYGKALPDLAEILPGVKVEILGPPTVEQYDKVLKQRSRDDEEFWMLRGLNLNYWQMQAETSRLTEEQNNSDDYPDQPFPNAKVYEKFSPSHTRWFIRRMREVRAEQLLGIVRILDSAMNNTSVILLFMVGGKKLLFPGDAQIENWEYVLKHAREDEEEEKERQRLLKLLKNTNVYKVGHHGSRNATPKTLWNKFVNKSKANMTEEEIKKSMHTICSTMPGKHGHTEATKVPRQTLVDELKGHTQYRTTEMITKDYRDNDEITVDEHGLYFEIEL